MTQDPKLVFRGSVDDAGKIILPGKAMHKQIPQAFTGKPIEVIVQRRKKRRSSPQNRWYWGVAIEILTTAFREYQPDVLIDKDIVHTLLKEKFLPVVKGGKQTIAVPETGEAVEVPYTTTRLTTSEMCYYKDLIQAWAADLNIIIPDPYEDFEAEYDINNS